MSLEDRIKAFAAQVRARLLELQKASETAEEPGGKAYWVGYDANGNGIVKKNGVEKTVRVIGNISLPKGAVVYIDSQNTIEIRRKPSGDDPTVKNLQPKTVSSSGASLAANAKKRKELNNQIFRQNPYVVESRPLIIQGDQRDFVICIAVIDENDNDPTVTDRWISFRETYPDRPFYLLQPVPSSGLSIPSSQWGDEYLAYYQTVCRESCTSDWFIAAELNGANKKANVILFIDESGSMNINTVMPSYNLFKSKCINDNLKVKTVVNTAEDYITPFLVADDFFSGYETVWPY